MTIAEGNSVKQSSEISSFELFKQPFPMIFSCKEFPFPVEEKDEALRVIKKRVLEYSDAKAEFNDEGYSFKLFHQEKEVQALINYLNLEKYFNIHSISYTQVPTSISFYAPHVIMSLQNDGYYDFKSSVDSMLEEAQSFYKTRDVVSISASDDFPMKATKIFSSLLKDSDGLCIGELYHCDFSPKAHLIKQMEELYELGVRTLYLEHVFYDTMYESLAENRKVAPHIELYLQGLDSGQGVKSPTYTYSNLVRKAHEVGMRVVPIDTSVSYACGNSRKYGIKSRDDRIIGMNFVATRIIEEEQKRDGAGKYVALMGIAHVAEHVEGVPGVSELLGVPSVVMTDGSEQIMSINAKHDELLKPVSVFLQSKVGLRKARKRANSYGAEESPSIKRQKRKSDD